MINNQAGGVGVPTRELEGIREADVQLAATMRQLDDAAIRRASRLPGWTVGHVLTHIARNGDSVVRRLEGARDGRIVDQYPGGPQGRAAEIEAGARRSAAELTVDVTSVAASIQAVAATLSESAWDNQTRSVSGDLVSAERVMFSRWREVEVHHVDLGLGYAPGAWPESLTRRWLASQLHDLPDRCSPQQLLAWLLGRGEPPALKPWE